MFQYGAHFPKTVTLLNKKYILEFVSETINEIAFDVVTNDGDRVIILTRFVFKKQLDDYLNMIHFDNMVCRNLEGFMYWKEVNEQDINFDDRPTIFKKYNNKAKVLSIYK